ncbi:murein hydrolase activator EnvC family protein [Beggiatoa leptomitoformis]|uniref:Peptidoglycan DD-metalloendopeptidase family protein n=1 Tax=Beggiatoa leptomitoformis TaxID=288004 RepID=A0A2N9Y9Y1_9GAMM|nr:peptidoglycan DD-metalloendopeptidase family protein [Beggiatoa leptomitoformis]ALG69351.2 peptidoglycan DD-metalloendopeptidase family protein [Beggiatoa leptomitoformis]AUI67259.2 peptidoglycan DD-metalloendopeptidase family protein [Beggiatoa leptomitoformis]
MPKWLQGHNCIKQHIHVKTAQGGCASTSLAVLPNPFFMLRYRLFTYLLILLPATSLAESTADQLHQLTTRIQTLQDKMQDTRTEYGRLQRQLQRSEEDIGETAERLDGLNEELTDKRNSLANLEQQQQQQTQKLEEQRLALAKQVRAAYLTGQQDYLKLWLNQQDPFTVGRVLTYYDYINRARIQKIETINATLQHIQTLSQQIKDETNTINTLIDEHHNKKAHLETGYQDRQGILEELARTIESTDKEIKRLQDDKKQLEQLLGIVDKTFETLPPPVEPNTAFTALKGNLPLPVTGNITKKFGDELIGSLKYQGLLINAPQGEKVKSVAAGRIAFADWFRNMGQLIIIDHGKGYMSLYGHNQSLYVKTGDWVETGNPIASVGNSGGRNITGLYFEIRYQGAPIDPLTWLHN